jgi:hypothetical protein
MPDGSRRILSPRGPRAASASYAYSQFTGSPHLTAGGQETPPSHHPDNTRNLSRPQTHQLPPISSAASLPGTPSVSVPQPARTNSQPLLGPTHPIAPAPYATTTQRRPWPAPSQPSQPQSVPDGISGFPRSVSTPGLTSPAGWQNLLRDRQNLPSEGNETITATLPDGQEIPVTLDMTTGSARQSQKRSRNAEASGRHRSKRKAQTSDMQKEIDALKEERENTQRRMEELARERDFYREERNRLQDLVSRTAQISHLAPGPPSPGGPSTHLGQALRGSNVTEISSTDPRRQPQGYPVAHSGREGPTELLTHQSENDTHGRAPQGGYGRPNMSRESSHGLIGSMASGMSEHRPPAAIRTPSTPQLPPIGAMGSSLANPSSQGQPWEQERQPEQWTRTHGRPNPGWATGMPETPDAPSR